MANLIKRYVNYQFIAIKLVELLKVAGKYPVGKFPITEYRQEKWPTWVRDALYLLRKNIIKGESSA